MNFTPELTALQGVILSADNVNAFSRLTERGGNEDEIEEVVTCLKKFLLREQYINESTLLENNLQQTRKFAFYIILNADLQILESMVEKEGIDFLIWTIPTVPKCLMCEILWKLHMDKFVSEIIAFCCPQLSVEVAESFTNHMKYLSPMESTAKVKLIAKACYKLICRLNFHNSNENIIISTLTSFQKCLKYFVKPPNIEKLAALKRNQLYKHLGENLYNLLLLLYECFEEFNGVQKFQLSDHFDIYMLTYSEESVINKDDIKTTESNNMVLDCLHKCHDTMLETLKELVMGVSVDVFCTWSEFEEKGKSMQQTIGELSYKLHSKLLSIGSISDHPVIQMLQQISCKPIEVEDIINDTSTSDIIENIKNALDRPLWVQALLKRDNLCLDLNLVESLISNLDVLKEDEFYKLYNICIEHINSFTENKEAVKLLAIKAFENCDITTKHNIVDNAFQQNCFSDEMETTQFSVMMIKIFNKLIATPETDLSNVLTIFIQNPGNVFQKVFTLATENPQQCVIMGRIMKYLEKYSNFYYNRDTEACIIKLAKDTINNKLQSEAEQDNFINFVSHLKNNNIIPGAKLLLLVIMPGLHEALLNRKFVEIYIQTKMLTTLYTLEELLEYRAPMLVMIAQVLDVVRWKIHTFHALGPPCIKLATQMQSSLIATYQGNIPEKESSWLKSKLKKKNPLNMYYYRMLWDSPGDNYLEVLTDIHVHKEIDIDHLTFCMSQILCVTIINEWYLLWESMSILNNTTRLDVFHNALILISTAEKGNRSESTWACLLYCFKNFLLIIRYKYICEPLTDEQVITIIKKIASIVNLLEEADIEDFNSVSLPLLAYIAESRDCRTNILESVDEDLKNLTFASLIHKLFSSGLNV